MDVQSHKINLHGYLGPSVDLSNLESPDKNGRNGIDRRPLSSSFPQSVAQRMSPKESSLPDSLAFMDEAGARLPSREHSDLVVHSTHQGDQAEPARSPQPSAMALSHDINVKHRARCAHSPGRGDGIVARDARFGEHGQMQDSRSRCPWSGDYLLQLRDVLLQALGSNRPDTVAKLAALGVDLSDQSKRFIIKRAQFLLYSCQFYTSPTVERLAKLRLNELLHVICSEAALKQLHIPAILLLRKGAWGERSTALGLFPELPPGYKEPIMQPLPSIPTAAPSSTDAAPPVATPDAHVPGMRGRAEADAAATAAGPQESGKRSCPGGESGAFPSKIGEGPKMTGIDRVETATRTPADSSDFRGGTGASDLAAVSGGAHGSDLIGRQDVEIDLADDEDDDDDVHAMDAMDTMAAIEKEGSFGTDGLGDANSMPPFPDVDELLNR